MDLSFRPPQLCRLAFSALLLLGAPAAFGQAAAAVAPGYDFLTVTSLESGAKSLAKVLITPAFQGKSEIQLEPFIGFSTEKNLSKLQHNTELVNQHLTELTTAGWELVQTYPFSYTPDVVATRYLFRKARH